MVKRIQTIDESKTLQFDKDMEIYKSKIESLNVENERLKIDKQDIENTLQ